MGLILPLLVIALPQAAGGMIAGSLMFAVIITALFFLVAYFFQSPQLTAVAHEEFAALIFSAIIILVWISGDAFFNGITNGLVGGSAMFGTTAPTGFSTTHVDLAIHATEVFRSKAQGLYVNLYLYEILIGFLSTISFPFGALFSGPAIVSFSLMPFISLGMLSNVHTSVVETLGLLVAAIWVKEFILIFCRDILPLILLPLGLVMRAFPFSRTTGSSIIAVCFVGFFVFPVAVLFSYYMIFDLYQPSEPPPVPSMVSVFKTSMTQDDANAMLDEAKAESKQRENLFDDSPIAERAATGNPDCAGHELLCSAENVAKGAWNFAKQFVSTLKNIWTFMLGFTGDFHSVLGTDALLPSGMASGLYYFIIREVSHVAQFMVAIVLTSLMEIIITITMYRNIAWIIGGEMELAGITKIM
ncbi:hypothetical protein H0O02_04570 [Candidatus Micrarchaeota archaeon]|nr:hypothetical protein [Candidatus Micrarchaeota archaeon]